MRRHFIIGSRADARGGIEIETDGGLVGVVHAECPFDDWTLFKQQICDESISKKTRRQVIAIAQWARSRIEYEDRHHVLGVRAVVVGHTPVRAPTALGNVHYIDTMAWQGGYFTIIDANTLQQATS